MEEILKLSHVSKYYPKFKLDDVSLSLPCGCIMGFIGENGAGKSTTIKLILDLVNIDSGEISIFGEDHKTLTKDMKEYIGTVMDALHLPDEMTAGNVSSVMRRVYKTWHQEVFDKYMKKFRIDTKKRVKEYSRGMKMKLSLAIALSHDTKLLILDEATSGLDPVAREQILDILLDFIQDENHGVFISSHILSDLEKVCDYITFIHNGKIVFSEEKDMMMEKYGILKCSAKQLEEIERDTIVAKRSNQFGVQALVLRDRVPDGMTVDPAGLEDIMVFYGEEA